MNAGKKKNSQIHSCLKIIQANPPSTGDHHGCPFKHFSQGNLEARLYRDQLNTVQVNEIMDLVNGKHYQVACTRYYEMTHPAQKEKIEIIQHPNQFYEASKTLSDATKNQDAMDVD